MPSCGWSSAGLPGLVLGRRGPPRAGYSACAVSAGERRFRGAMRRAELRPRVWRVRCCLQLGGTPGDPPNPPFTPQVCVQRPGRQTTHILNCRGTAECKSSLICLFALCSLSSRVGGGGQPESGPLFAARLEPKRNLKVPTGIRPGLQPRRSFIALPSSLL